MSTEVETPPVADRPLPDDRLKEMLHLLKLCRYFDERMEALYRQGRLPGAIYSGRGQEGTHVGVAFPLEPTDSLFVTHRDLSAQLIYSWEAHAEDVAPLLHAHPTQNEALGEAHLALAGTPLHAHS